jgi:hypothetical protein
MPGFDGTGPRGQGAMTGGGRGVCNGRGRGRGMRNCFIATGMPGWMRAQKGMRAFGGYGRATYTEDRPEQGQ